MKILFLTSRFPYPPYRGDKLKIYNLIKQLSGKHEITLLSFISSKSEREYVDTLRKFCVEVNVVYLPPWRSVLNCLLNVFSARPFQVAYFSSINMSHCVSSYLAEGRFDVVHVHLIRMAQYLSDITIKPVKVLDLTDAGSLYLERFLHQSKSMVKKIFLKIELQRLRMYEKVLEKFDTNLVCSPVDRDFLYRNAPDAAIELLYNGVDLEYFSANSGITAESFTMVYTGNMSYFPNVDGAEFLVDEILPLIKKRFSHVKLYIVGQSPPLEVRKLANSSIVVTGFVPDIKEFYLKGAVAVAPVRFGAGTLNKILEPMALGIPVVSTSIGVEGLPVRGGEHVLIANNANDFANSVIALFDNAGLRNAISQNGKELVRSLYDWKTIGLNLENVYNGLLNRR